MNTPVLIAARNEAENIGRTLKCLPRNIEPIVLANGCEDNTVNIARDFGVRVHELDQPGKLPALQQGMKLLGNRALEPFVTLDADTRPLVAQRWINALRVSRDELPKDKPAVVIGGLLLKTKNPVSAALHSAAHARRHFIYSTDPDNGTFSGANMLLNLHDDETLERVLAMPHIWPGEDVALKDVVVDQGGKSLKTLKPCSLAITSGMRFLKMRDRYRLGLEATIQTIHNSYLIDAAPGSVPYSEPGQYHKNVKI